MTTFSMTAPSTACRDSHPSPAQAWRAMQLQRLPTEDDADDLPAEDEDELPAEDEDELEDEEEAADDPTRTVPPP